MTSHTGVKSFIIMSFMLLKLLTSAQYVTINTRMGSMRGSREHVLGKDMEIFLGIPYAKPPIGARRFKRPEAIEPWGADDFMDATRAPNACYQMVDTMFGRFEGVDMWNPNTPMSEDCLYLNVWAPSAPPHGGAKAVLVWIYGGSFTSGSSSLSVYDGRILSAYGDVVVVSMNYRMGALGFLYHGNSNVPGNMGLLDQALALQWIHNNIESFGGDRNRITVFGESAGSVSASMQLLSPLAQDYIANIILMSGTAQSHWATDDTHLAKQKADLLAELVGCPTSSSDAAATYHCLMSVSPGALSNETWSVADRSKVPTPLGPVVDGHFLRDHPRKLLQTGRVKQANIMLGSVKNEGTYFMLYDARLASYFKFNESEVTEEKFLQAVGSALRNNNKALIDLVSFEYTHPQTFQTNSAAAAMTSSDYMDHIDAIITDTAFVCPMLTYAEYQVRANNSVYMYSFDHRTSVNPWPAWMGVMHGYEIDHVFGAPLNDSLGYREDEKSLSKEVMTYWANFAKSGYV